MPGILSVFRPNVLAGPLALGMVLWFAVAGRAADDVEGPVLRAPILDTGKPAEESSRPRLMQPEGLIGHRYAPGEKPAANAAPAKTQLEVQEESKTGSQAEAEPESAVMESETEAKPEAKPGAKPEKAPEEAPQARPEPKPELSPQMAAMRDSVRRTLAGSRRQWFNTRDHSVTDILHVCLAYGCEAQVRLGSSSGQVVNAITCLCWNYPCRGEEPLTIAEGHITGRIGYGLQTERSQLLAILAQSEVPIDYPIRVGKDVRKVADMVEYEKLTCRHGVDASLKLVGLAFYVDKNATWEDNLGETWSLERLVDEELGRPALEGSAGGVNRLMGLSSAVHWQVARNLPVDGAFERASRYTRRFHDHALKCQNSDGSWNRSFFAAVGISRDPASALRSTGRILEWLAYSLPEERLEDPQVVKAVAKVNTLLSTSRYLGGATRLDSLEIGSMMHAVRALAIYDQRVFRPHDPTEPAEEKPAAGQ